MASFSRIFFVIKTNMTWNCADPIANPFNTRCDGNFNLLAQNTGRHGYFFKHGDPSELRVPPAKMFSREDLFLGNG